MNTQWDLFGCVHPRNLFFFLFQCFPLSLLYTGVGTYVYMYVMVQDVWKDKCIFCFETFVEPKKK